MLQSANLFFADASARGIDLLARGFAHLTPWLQGLLGSWQPPGWLRAVGRLLAGVGSALQARLAGMAWSQIETSWYMDGGRITNNWAGSTCEYLRLCRRVDWTDFKILKAAS